jgi:hypothetical protein
MVGNDSQVLLDEAAMLITVTRLRIARSMTLLAKVALTLMPHGEAPVQNRAMRRSSNPPNATTL